MRQTGKYGRIMLKPILPIWLPFILFCFSASGQATEKIAPPIAIVIHGGAGTITRDNMTEEMEKAYTRKLREAVDSGYRILEEGGSSMKAVAAAIEILEDSPLFNAGKGAVFTHEGTNELDASIMDGATLEAGAVAGVRHIKNPIKAAVEVMARSPHVLLCGSGADAFAALRGLKIVDTSYFYTEHRYRALQELLRQKSGGSGYKKIQGDDRYGTVGAVALDRNGNLAAGTSTGGMTDKRFGRIGDTPIIGAGTYADNQSCAVSSTGHGEYFIRKVVAYDIAARMKYGGMNLQEACEKVILEELPAIGGSGGVIALDRVGNISMIFNTSGMYRAYRKSDGESRVEIYDKE